MHKQTIPPPSGQGIEITFNDDGTETVKPFGGWVPRDFTQYELEAHIRLVLCHLW